MIKVGIVGYGNLGRGVTLAVNYAKDMECVGIFTRRNPESLKPAVDFPVYSIDKLKDFKGQIDVLLLCGGSATDLPSTTAEYLKDFNTVDSFDTHAKIPEYFNKLDKVAKEHGTLSAISIGWDPGVFSIARMLFGAVLPNGNDYTFWGNGVSQGHSDAIRRIDGVQDAKQYTIPVQKAMDLVRSGVNPTLSTREKHERECFVVAKDGADKERIEREIKTMPNYFADYDTTVHFISQEELNEKHGGLPHGGVVIHTGVTGKKNENKHVIEYSLNLDSNSEFTSSVLVTFARALYRMNADGVVGCKTVFDVPPIYLSDKSREEVIASLL